MAATALMPATLDAQQSAYGRAETAVERALGIQATGDFRSAHALLRDAVTGCSAAGADTTDARRCRDLVYFSLGYLLQREAEDAPDAEPLLRRAVDYYTEVASASDSGTTRPLAADAVLNLALVYRTIGPQEWQEPQYVAAPERDVERKALHYTFLGDYYAALGRWREALSAYRAAAQADPDGEAAREGMLEVYRRMGVGGMQELLRLAEDWEPRFPELAARAYEVVIERTYADAPALAERALIRYVWVVSRGRALDAAAVRRLPADWAPAAQLAAYVEAPVEPRSAAPWWLSAEEPARALARVALAIGQREVSMGRPAAAERYWSAARDLADVTTAEALDLKRELALLYFRHDALDPDGAKFDRLEQDLFEEKGGVLAARNLEAAQRYHTILGQIYAERQVWQSTVRARNAIDQLTWALDIAARRDAAEQFRQPLPELRSLLAAGLERTGNERAARARYHEAAIAFLDTDDMAGAATASSRAVQPGRTHPLAELIAFRGSLREALATNASRAAGLCDRSEIGRALRAVERVDARFATRQRFKILSDCVATGPAERRAAYGAEALTLVVQDDVTLTGIGDVLRLEKATAAVRERATIRDYDAHIDFTPHNDRHELRTSLAGHTRPGYVSLPEDAVVAARVVHLIGEAPDPYRIRVREGAVTFDYDPARLLTTQLTSQIGRLDGVRAVQRAERQP